LLVGTTAAQSIPNPDIRENVMLAAASRAGIGQREMWPGQIQVDSLARVRYFFDFASSIPSQCTTTACFSAALRMSNLQFLANDDRLLATLTFGLTNHWSYLIRARNWLVGITRPLLEKGGGYTLKSRPEVEDKRQCLHTRLEIRTPNFSII